MVTLIRFAIPTQVEPRERRVALTPAAVAKLIEDGHGVSVEHGAGLRAGFTDDDYLRVGADVCPLDDAVATAEFIAMVTSPLADSENPAQQRLWAALGERHTVIGVHDPLWRPDRAAKLAATGATVFSLDLMPRTTKAQSMDVLSSMATVAGYEAGLLAASRIPKLVPLMMTAAGTVPAAKVLVLGAGVAGLQAIATTRRLGAIVEGYDIRPAATEQIASLGARAIETGTTDGPTEDAGGYARAQTEDVNAAQHRLLAPHVAEADAVITTAAIPGAASPLLITESMVDAMTPGSIIIDLAAERGGNCAVTRPDEEVERGGVTILGPTDLASRAAATASHLFGGNLVAFVRHLAPEGRPELDLDDEITAGTLLCRGGGVVHPRVRDELGSATGSDQSESDSGEEPR